MRVKICGITNIDDAMKAAYAGADALGFIFYKQSPRFVSPSKVKRIVEALPPFVTPVGVFVDAKEGAVKEICNFTGIRTLQLHGIEEPSYCRRLKQFRIIKAFRISSGFNFEVLKAFNVQAYLFDTFDENVQGGTGKVFNWKLLEPQKFSKPFILSGGLNAQNVIEALQMLKPYAVDVSSSVEKSAGLKDSSLIRAFIQSANLDLKV